MSRKIAAIVLLLALFAPMTASYTWLQFQKSLVKKEVKEQIDAGIERDKLVLLEFSKEEAKTKLRWEHSREFEYRGNMYDIVKTKVKQDSVYYWCWLDHEETKLNDQIITLLNKNSNDEPLNTNGNKILSLVFKPLYISGHFDWQPALDISEKKEAFLKSSNYSSLNFPPPVPPPENS